MKRRAEPAAAVTWPRADPAELAKFDPRSKVCTMNCGRSSDDPRSEAERQLLCTDCLPADPRPMRGCSECGWGKVAGCWRCGSR